MPIATTLPIKTLLEINAALSALEGTPTIVKGENGTEKVVTIPYQFGGKTRWNLAKNTSWMKRISEDFSKVRDALIHEVSAGADKIDPADEAKLKVFNEKLNDVFLTEESTKGLLSIPLSGLNLDVNQISPAVLSILEPIVDEEG